MAKMRHMDPKAALTQQRAELRRGARGKVHIGDDTGSAAGRAAERAKVHRMQELQHVREAEHAEEAQHAQEAQRERGEAERLQEPLVTIFIDLATDSFRLARTLFMLPFRLAAALRGHRAHAAEA